MSDAVRLSTELGVSASENPADLIHLDLAASAALKLPGLKASVEGIGIGLRLGIKIGDDGSVSLERTAVFLPPTGMAAELTLPLVSGGGYLGQTGDELRGALAANMGLVRASGFAILGTREFSLLVLLAAEFTPPLQLSFGFTLVGVGGLVGVHRRADTDALQDAVSSGRLSRLLFPRDPVGEADQLLATLSACFPHEDGSIVIGPMLKLGWGTPTLIAATIAVIADPMNARVLILGRIAVTLPAEDLALIRIEALIFGVVDDTGVSIKGSLVDSHIIGIPIEGDIQILIQASPRPLMVFSAGGFHPAFQPPPGLESLRRLSMQLSPAPILQIGVQAYFAVTSSAVMFGARLDLVAGIDGFGIRGHAAFDALLSIDPFYFMAHLEASVSITCADFDVAAVSLSGDLSGPAPWSIRGHASISILWWDIDVDLPEITWGPDQKAPQPAADPLVVLADQIGRPENWLRSSVDVPGLVILRPNTTKDAVAIHPLAAIEFRQNAIPLETEIQRVDGRSLAVPAILTMTTVASDSALVRDQFAPVRFFNVDPATSTGSAGFVELPAGRSLTGAKVVAGRRRNQELKYEQKVLMATNPWRRRIVVDFVRILGNTSHLSVARAAATPPVVVNTHHVVVAGTDVLQDATTAWMDRTATLGAQDAALGAQRASLLASTEAGVSSLIEAQGVVRRLAASDPSAAGAFQIVAAWEVRAR